MNQNESTIKFVCQGKLKSIWNGYCDRKGKYEHKGKWYCATHFPPNIKARSDEKDEKRRKGREELKRKTDAIAFERNVKNMVFDRVLRQHPEWVYEFAEWNLNLVSNSDELIAQWIELAKQREEKREEEKEKREKREGLPYEPEA